MLSKEWVRCSRVCQVGEERGESILEGDAVVEIVNSIEMMVTASCSINEDKVKELSAKGGIAFCARLEDRQC